MWRQRIGRGTSWGGVGVLLVSALALVPGPVNAADGPVAHLLGPVDGHLSLKPSGGTRLAAATLTAERRDPNASVRFQVNPDSRALDGATGWATIDVAGPSDDAFAATDWDGSIGGQSLVGTTVAVRAAGEVPGQPTTYSTVRDVLVTDGRSPVESVDVITSDGYFAQPYADSGRTESLVAVSGTTTASWGTVEVAPWRAAEGAFAGDVPLPLRGVDDMLVDRSLDASGEQVPVLGTGGRFRAALPVSAFAAQEGDQVAVRAVRDSDDVAVLSLRPVSVASIEVDVANSGPDSVTLDLGVRAADASPVAGAEVRRGDGVLVGYTDGAGWLRDELANGTVDTYYVNTTDADAYESDIDPHVVVDSAGPLPWRTVRFEPVLELGPVFDDRDYVRGGVTLAYVYYPWDPRRTAAEVSLLYQLYPTGTPAPAPVEGTTENQGTFVAPFDPSGPDGAYTLRYWRPGDEVRREIVFIAGRAALRLAPRDGRALSGGRIEYDGALTVAGWPFGHRPVTVRITRGIEKVPGREADAGILVDGVRKILGSESTDDRGHFTVTVADRPERGRPTESGGEIHAGHSNLAKTSSRVTFGSGKGRVSLRVTGVGRGTSGDRIRVGGPSSVGGERVRVLARAASGAWRKVTVRRLNRSGNLALTLRDRNGPRTTAFRVRLIESRRVHGWTSRVVRLR